MSTDNRQVEFNLEEKLAEMNLTPSQRHQALDAIRVAEDMVEIFQYLGAALKRVVGAVTLKPTIRA